MTKIGKMPYLNSEIFYLNRLSDFNYINLTPKNMAGFAKKFKDSGATILGGCCEASPKHIQEFSKLLK